MDAAAAVQSTVFQYRQDAAVHAMRARTDREEDAIRQLQQNIDQTRQDDLARQADQARQADLSLAPMQADSASSGRGGTVDISA